MASHQTPGFLGMSVRHQPWFHRLLPILLTLLLGAGAAAWSGCAQATQATGPAASSTPTAAVSPTPEVIPMTEQQFIDAVNHWNRIKGPGSYSPNLEADNGKTQRLGLISDPEHPIQQDDGILPAVAPIELAWIEIQFPNGQAEVIVAYGVESGEGIFGGPKGSKENGVFFVGTLFEKNGQIAITDPSNNPFPVLRAINDQNQVGSDQLAQDLLAKIPDDQPRAIDFATYTRGLQAASGKQVVMFPYGPQATDLHIDLTNSVFSLFSQLKLHPDSSIFLGTFSQNNFNKLATTTLPRTTGFAYSTAVIPLADRE